MFRLRQVAFIFLAFLAACEKDEVVIREFPRIQTLEVTDISQDGAIFKADLIQTGSGSITDYGFVWSTNFTPTVEYSEIISFTGPASTGNYSATIHNSLREGSTYYVKAYARNENYTSYGNKVSFVSLGSKAPVIQDFEPKTGIEGDTVTIYGKYFSNNKANVRVEFNGVWATIFEASDTILTVKVPNLTKVENDIKITIFGNSVIATDKFRLKVPEIEDFFPKEGKIGDTITITGNNLLIENIEGSVYLGNELTEIVSADDTEMKIIVPAITIGIPHPSYPREELLSKKIKITGSISITESMDHFLYLFPVIEDINPKTGNPGNTIVITGDLFVSPGYELNLYLAGIPMEIVAMNETEITAIVPDDSPADVDLLQYVEIKIGDASITYENKYSYNPHNPGSDIKTLSDEVTFGDTVIIYMDEIYGPGADVSVELTDAVAEVIEIGTGYGIFIVPDDNLYKNEMVKVFIDSEYYVIEGQLVVKDPVILSTNPSIVTAGDVITVIGENFSPSVNYCEIMVQNQSVPILSASKSLVTFILPANLQTENGTISIQYIALDLSSNIYSGIQLE